MKNSTPKLAKTHMKRSFGNVFNAKRDNKGKGIKIEDFMVQLISDVRQSRKEIAAGKGKMLRSLNDLR